MSNASRVVIFHMIFHNTVYFSRTQSVRVASWAVFVPELCHDSFNNAKILQASPLI